MITPDRPGFGGSDFQPGRRIDDWPGDATHLTQRLGVSRPGVLSFSGGTPYALALAACAPVSAVGIVSGDAPGRVPGAPSGLSGTAVARPRLTALGLRAIRVAAAIAPGFTTDRATAMLAPPDRAAVAGATLRRTFLQPVREALRQGAAGPLLDLRLAGQEWAVVPPRDAVPVHLWHGEADPDSPVAVARHLAGSLPGARLHTYPGEGHVSVLLHDAADVLTTFAVAG